MPPTATPVPPKNAAGEFEPPDTTFWQRYNAHLEFPTSVLISVFTLTLAFGFIVLVVVAAMMGRPDKSSVPLVLVEGGEDDSGSGSSGSGGDPNPATIAQTAAPQQADFAKLPLTKDLPQVREDIQKAIDVEDPNASTPVSDEKAAAYAALDAALRDRLLGQQRGSGPDAGRGDTGQPGGGPGGTGASSTRARSLRWILRFSTRSGRDYLDQLHVMGAVVLVPLPDGKQMYMFRDLKNPKPGPIATDGDLAALSGQIQFCDFKRDSVVAVSEALGLNYTPTQFWAFFPRGMEDELARLETGYKNKRPEDILETVFVVSVVGGRPKLVVADQKVK
jgi:hypothetical protein